MLARIPAKNADPLFPYVEFRLFRVAKLTTLYVEICLGLEPAAREAAIALAELPHAVGDRRRDGPKLSRR